MSSKTRSRRTKTEVQQEFVAIAQEVEEEKLSASSKETIAQQLKEAELRNAVSGISVEIIIHKMADLNSEISKSLSHLAEKLIAEVNLLNQVRSAITIENEQLQKLHKIDIATTALDQLIEEYQNKKSELELEIETQRTEWEKEKTSQEEATVTLEKNLKNTRVREIEEYEYKRNLERKKDLDKYEEECRLSEKQNREKQETLEKSWQLREESLKMHEDHSNELQKAVDVFPSRLKEEVERARSEAIQQTEQRLSQQLLISQKDKEAEQRLSEMKIRSLEETASRQQDQIAHLQKQLDEAKKEVKEIAEKAIEGASGARALSHINQIAMEQAKNRSSTN